MIINSGMAFSEGFFARTDGQTCDDNRYSEGLRRWSAWRAGWEEAIATARAMQTARTLIEKPTCRFTLAGEEAACTGTPVSSDPFPDGSLESDLWLAGWTGYQARKRLSNLRL